MVLVYAHFHSNGGSHIQAFQKPESAADYVFSYLSNIVRNSSYYKSSPLYAAYGVDAPFDIPARPAAKRKSKPVENDDSPELKTLQDFLKSAAKDRSLDSANKAISLYEDYMTYVKLAPSKLHSLQSVRLMED